MIRTIWLTLLLALPGAMVAAPPKAPDCSGCHDVDAAKFEKSIHGAMGCVSCHADAGVAPHKGKPKTPDCTACHKDTVTQFAGSAHGQGGKPGTPLACAACHGSPHEMLKASEPTSRTNRKNLPETCGSCHSDPAFAARHNVGYIRPVEAYRNSVHGRAVAKGHPSAATCSDCHGSHDIQAILSGKSATSREKVVETCGTCHGDAKRYFEESVHGQAVKRGNAKAPVCTDCHGEHTILGPSEPGSPVSQGRVAQATCSRCHADERIAGRFGMSADKVASFQNSFHGLAVKAGSKSAANCASCHGSHFILKSSDPRSTIHKDNLARTCGYCHQGVNATFLTSPIHVTADTQTEHPVVRWIRLTYWLLIPLTLGFMISHHLLDYLKKLRRGKVHHFVHAKPVKRMNLHFRLAHGLVVASFLSLVFTGFALKYPDSFWAAPFMSFGEYTRAIVHRTAACIILFATAYHCIHLMVVKKDRIVLRELLPSWKDAKDLFNMFRYNLGFIDQRPTFGMFGYMEKIEYWAFMWGTVVMAVTGLLLWGENWSMRHLPKWVLDAATAAHWYEAILATFSILIWHWYLVIFDPDVYPMDMAWLNGKADGAHLMETRPEYYRQRLEKETGEVPEEPEED